MDYTQDRLSIKTAKFAAGYDGVCLFVNDTADADVLWTLSMGGVKSVFMRCAGFDRVDIKATKLLGMSVARVPAYSPYAVAEHAITLLLSVNRRIAAASVRVKMSDFSLDSSLLGMDIHGKTIGVMGTGKIGQILCRIITGFGVNLLAYDVEVINVLTVLLRKTTKVVCATMIRESPKDKVAGLQNSKKVLRMLCYDTTSWVEENFEPQVSI